jgi:DNA polymerase-3 subunit delta
LTPDALQEELDTGRVRSAYLIAGSEALLRDAAIAALKRVVLGDAPADFNFDRFEGDAVGVAALGDALHMLPVFAARRLVWVREPSGGRGSWKAVCEALPTLGKELGADAPAVLVVSATSIDRRTAWVRVFGDALVECEAPRGKRELVAFVKQDAKQLGLGLESGAAEELVERVGASLIGLHNELEKASLLAGPGAKIRVADIVASAADLAEEPVWDLTDAIGEGRVGDALAVLAKVLGGGAPAPVVLGTLASHFRKLLRLRTGGAVAGPPFVTRKLENQARRYAPARLLVCLHAIHETDQVLKGQGALPPPLALERLVLGLSA